MAVTGREQLYAEVTAGVRRLLDCDACQLWLRDGDAGGPELVASEPTDELRGPRVEARATLRDDRAELGALVALRSGTRAFGAEHEELLQAVANQVALALRNAEHIERLTAENLVRSLFESLEEGALDVAEARARAAGADLDRPHVVIHARPQADDARPWPAVAEHLDARLRTWRRARSSTGARGPARAAAAPAGRGRAAARHAAQGAAPARRGGGRGDRHERAARRRRGGRPGPARGPRRRHHRARPLPGGGALAYDGLGAYRYLVHLAIEDAPHDRLCEAVERLLDYDARRETQLLPTLEQYLADRRVGATTARKLFIHANTLRQRLDRIEKLSGLDLSEEDLLSLELAVKLVRLRRAGGADPTPDPEGDVGREVHEEDERAPPDLDLELEVGLAADLDPRQPDQREEREPQDVGHRVCEKEKDHPDLGGEDTRRVTIRAKLFAAIAMTVLGPLVTIAVAFTAFNALSDRFDEVTDHSGRQALALEIKYAVTDVNGWQTATATTTVPAGRSSTARRRTSAGCWRRARPEMTEARERAMLAQVREAFGRFMALDVVAFDALKKGQDARVKRIFLGPEIRNFEDMAAAAARLAAEEERRTKQVQRRFDKRLTDAKKALVIVGLGAGGGHHPAASHHVGHRPLALERQAGRDP